MPDLADRKKREKELALAVVVLLSSYADEMQQGLAMPGFRRNLPNRIAPILGRAFAQSAQATARQVNIGVAGLPQAGIAWGTSFASPLSNRIADRLALRFGNRLLTPAEVSIMAQGTLDAEMWGTFAATEITRAATAGSEYTAAVYRWVGPTKPPDEGFIVKPAIVTTLWFTELDERVCPICLPLHGEPREVWSYVAPLGPPAHPNCRCWLDYVPSEET